MKFGFGRVYAKARPPNHSKKPSPQRSIYRQRKGLQYPLGVIFVLLRTIESKSADTNHPVPKCALCAGVVSEAGEGVSGWGGRTADLTRSGLHFKACILEGGYQGAGVGGSVSEE